MTKLENNEYQCSLCKVTYIKGWSDEEAMDEALDLYDMKNDELLDVICDDCFNHFYKWYINEDNKL